MDENDSFITDWENPDVGNDAAIANSLSPRPLWERWGYACEISCNGNEIRIYPKDDDGHKIAGSCLYRSYYRKDWNVWLHRRVDSSEILIMDIPGNRGNDYVFKKDKFGHILLDAEEKPIPNHITTNISLAVAFERAKLFENYKKNKVPYDYFQVKHGIELVLKYGEPMEEYLNFTGSQEKPISSRIHRTHVSQSAFTNKRIFLHTCRAGEPKAHLEYLRQRHISEQTAKIFEDAHILYYNTGSERYFPSLAFCGWKRITELKGMKLPVPAYEPAFVAKRLITGEKDALRQGDAQLHNDIFGSNRAYVPFIEGHDTGLAIFVEGGVDMLSIAEIALRAGKPLPTIIMTAGSTNRQLWDNEALVETLQKASRAIFVGENDSHLTPQKQRGIRMSLEGNLNICKKIVPDARIIYPPKYEGIKDSNDMLSPENSKFLPDFIEEIFAVPPAETPKIQQ